MNKLFKAAALLLLTILPVASFAGQFDVYVNGYISEKSLAKPTQQILQLHAGDTVYVHIMSEGGEMKPALEFVKVMLQSPAYVVTVVDKYAASAATDILLSSDRMVIAQNAKVLFHLGSVGNLTISSDMGIDRIEDPGVQNYVYHVIKFVTLEVTKINFDKSQVYQALHGENGITVRGSDIATEHPSMQGLKHDADFKQAVNEIRDTIA